VRNLKRLIKKLLPKLGLAKKKSYMKGSRTMQAPKSSDKTSICAIVCVRNEKTYLPGLIKHLQEQGVEITFIDNGSTDGSREIMESYIGNGVIAIHDLPFNGAFSLSDQLQAKARVEQGLKHEWILHVDADEIHHASTDGATLVDIARSADKQGCNAINFEEFVFLPDKEQDNSSDTAYLNTLRYYYYAPIQQRLVRLYRRGQGLDNRSSGGHKVNGNPIIYPQTQVLRHYITLNQNHLERKYLGRIFDTTELEKGWHRNRVGLTAEMLSLDRFTHGWFDYLPNPESRAFLRNRPKSRHFWIS
jgi:glycosyltransferase involved in cell wall biosynthesis